MKKRTKGSIKDRTQKQLFVIALKKKKMKNELFPSSAAPCHAHVSFIRCKLCFLKSSKLFHIYLLWIVNLKYNLIALLFLEVGGLKATGRDERDAKAFATRQLFRLFRFWIGNSERLCIRSSHGERRIFDRNKQPAVVYDYSNRRSPTVEFGH